MIITLDGGGIIKRVVGSFINFVQRVACRGLFPDEMRAIHDTHTYITITSCIHYKSLSIEIT